MINLLSRIFIKNRTDYSNPFVRQQYGTLCGAFGIFLNVVLFGLKLIFGILASSVAMIADAFNSAGDIFASIMTFVGNKIASTPSDDDHNLGHGKAEYIFSLLIGISMIFCGGKILINSTKTLINKK